MSTNLLSTLLAGGLAIAGTVAGVTVPHRFQSGTPARAEEINENFEVLAEAIPRLESGSFKLGAELRPDERRRFQGRVAFKVAYEATPAVVVGLQQFDIGASDGNHRLTVEVKSVDERGFDYEIRTWAATTLYSCQVSWFSYGQ